MLCSHIPPAPEEKTHSLSQPCSPDVPQQQICCLLSTCGTTASPGQGKGPRQLWDRGRRDTGRTDQEQPVPPQVKPLTQSHDDHHTQLGLSPCPGAAITHFPHHPPARRAAPHTCLCCCGLTTLQPLDTVWDWDQLDTAPDSCSNLLILPQQSNRGDRARLPQGKVQSSGSGGRAGHWTHSGHALPVWSSSSQSH